MEETPGPWNLAHRERLQHRRFTGRIILILYVLFATFSTLSGHNHCIRSVRYFLHSLLNSNREESQIETNKIKLFFFFVKFPFQATVDYRCRLLFRMTTDPRTAGFLCQRVTMASLALYIYIYIYIYQLSTDVDWCT